MPGLVRGKAKGLALIAALDASVRVSIFRVGLFHDFLSVPRFLGMKFVSPSLHQAFPIVWVISAGVGRTPAERSLDICALQATT